MIVLGIDPSLTATGLAVIDLDDILVPQVQTVTSTGRAGATLLDRDQRLGDITGQIANLVRGYGAHGNQHPKQPAADIAVIESPSLGQARQSGQLDRHGLWWLIVRELHQHVDVIEVTPAARAKYATGRGNAGKDEVLLAVARRYPHVDVTNNNEADALVLAAIGARLAGHPIEDSLPQAHLDALTKIHTPEEVAS